MSIVSHKI